MSEMRKIKFWILAIAAILTLVSLRDKEIVLHVPAAKQLVAEAYQSPPDSQSPSSPIGVSDASGIQSQSGDSSYGYSDASNSSGSYTPQSISNPGTLQNPDTPQNLSSASSGSANPAATQAPIYYGLGGYVAPTSDTDSDSLSTNGLTGGTGTSGGSGQSDTETPKPVFITGLLQNSAKEGVEIIIQGAGFSATASENGVKFGSVQATSVAVVSVNQLRAAVPAGLADGFTDVSISVNGSDSKPALFDILKDTAANVFLSSFLIMPNGTAFGNSLIFRPVDFDNDKDMDIVVVDRKLGGAVHFFRNESAGNMVGFVENTPMAWADPSPIDGITDIKFGDVNQDGYPDMLLTSSKVQPVWLYLNDGNGGFTLQGASLPALSGMAVKADFGDIDGDGYLDIVVAMRDSKDILLVNDGTGTFTKDENFILPATIDGSSDIRFCDIDNDGDLDIITTNRDVIESSVLQNRIYRNNGSGLFADVTDMVMPDDSENSEVLDIGDLDRDGNIDMVVGSYGQNLLLINKGGYFDDKTSELMPTNYFHSKDIKLGDLNGDGYLDLMILGEEKVSLLMNDGAGSFKEGDASIKLPDYKSIPALVGGQNIQLADMDGDGALDIITGGSSLRILTSSAVNKAPVLDPIGNRQVEAGKSLTFNINATDPNGDALIYSAENLPSGAIFQAANKLFSWTPGSGAAGEYKNVVFKATEDSANPLEDSEAITITVTSGDLPVIDYYLPVDLDIETAVGDIVQFGLKAHDPKGGTLTFKWLFNGKEVPDIGYSDSSVIFIIPKIGSNTIEIQVTNAAGTVSVNWNLFAGENLPPVIDTHTPADHQDIDLTQGAAINFNITAHDPEGDVLSYTWKLDGIALDGHTNSVLDVSSFFANLKTGTHALTVEVNDGYNDPVIHQWVLDVTQSPTNSAPEIKSHIPPEDLINIDLAQGIALAFGITATDPDGDTLTYIWRLDGIALSSTTKDLSAGAYASQLNEGDHTLSISVNDGHQHTVTQVWTLHVTQGSTNNAPQANNDSAATNINTSIDIDVLANDSDIDGNQISISSIVTQPSHGTATISSGKIHYVPTTGYTGPDSFTYKVTDGLLESNTATVNIAVNAVNNAPQANNDSAATNINTSIDIDVLANDSDIDGNQISISSIVTQPSHGTATISSGKIHYVPTTDYLGDDSFIYRITDGSAQSNDATVTVTVEQSLPKEILQKSINYFWNETDNPETGFVRDRLLVDPTPGVRQSDTRYTMASMAATGFGLAALAVADSDPDVGGSLTHEQILGRVTLIMDKLLEIQANQAPNTSESRSKWGRDGFFYHYVNIDTAERWTESGFASEVSTIDTAILVAGVLTAGDYFGGDIKDKATQIYSNINWKAFLDTNRTVQNGHVVANPYYNQIYHAWTPETTSSTDSYGFSLSHWDYTSECLLIYLLAAAAPSDQGHNILPEAFYSIRHELGNYGADGSGNPMVKSYFGALFTYQYTQAFFNFKDADKGALYDAQGVDWWENSVEATRANKRYCNDYAGSFANEMDIWGLTSGYVSGESYVTYGAYPAAVAIPSSNVQGADGTVFPAAAGGSIAMLPEECLRALNKMKDVYDNFLGKGVWGEYGFANSFRINTGLDNLHFIANYYCGIDMGITLVMTENNRTGLIWDHFSNFDVGGTSLRNKIIELVEFSKDRNCDIVVDDMGEKSGFRMGKIDASDPTFEVRFDLTDVQNAPYLLAINSYMDTSLSDYTVTVTVTVNDGEPFDVDFKYLQAGKTADLMKYIPVDYQDLKPNEANVITLQYKGIAGDNHARWLAWRNVELSSPAEHDTWNFARDDQADPKVLFGSEYRVDDTYFIGADVASFEQAINKDVENFTDILFYTTAAQTDYAALVLNILETDRSIDTHVQVFAGGVGSPQAMIFNGPMRAGQQFTTSGYAVQSGWNRITIYHPGLSINDPLKGEWVRWNSLGLIAIEPPNLSAPQEVGAAAFGNDKVKLRWKAVNYAAKYMVYRSETPNGTYTTPITTVTTTAYTDSGLQTGKSYYYVVKAAKEDDPSADSQNSSEVSAVTGSYRLDYGDGHDPNTFTGATLGNSGAPLSDAAYSELVKYDGTMGKVRKITLNNGEKNTIELKNTNISDATIFSLRVRSDIAGAKFQMKLKDSAGGQASVSIISPTAGLWQNMLFYFGSGKQLAGIDLSKIDQLEITSETSGKQITIYLDEVDFNIVTISGTTMDIALIDGASGALAASIDFGSTTSGTPKVLANQYVKISNYRSSMSSWGIQIYTDNLAADANPRFTGNMPSNPADVRVNGLIGTSDSGYRVPILWQVWDYAKGYYNGTETPEYDTNGYTRTNLAEWDGDRAEFAFMMDKSDGDWSKDQYSPNYRTLINSSGELGAPVPFDEEQYGYSPRRIPVGNALYVYLAVDYTGAPAQTYTTNKITIDIYQK